MVATVKVQDMDNKLVVVDMEEVVTAMTRLEEEEGLIVVTEVPTKEEEEEDTLLEVAVVALESRLVEDILMPVTPLLLPLLLPN